MSARRPRQSSTAAAGSAAALPVARRVGRGHDPVAGPGDVAVADLPAQVDELARVFALVHHEHHVDGVQLADGLHRDVLGIARPDADDRDRPHCASPFARSPARPRSRPGRVQVAVAERAVPQDPADHDDRGAADARARAPGRPARPGRSAAPPRRASWPGPRPRPGSPRRSAAAGPRPPGRCSAPPGAGPGCSRWRPSAARSSPGGIGVARAAVRVSTTVWPDAGQGQLLAAAPRRPPRTRARRARSATAPRRRRAAAPARRPR